jgi:hypothetical protein
MHTSLALVHPNGKTAPGSEATRRSWPQQEVPMRFPHSIQSLRWVLAGAAITTLIAACGGGSGSGTTGGGPQPMGTLRVALTDMPACGFDEVNVTVRQVRVHASPTAPENASGWFDMDVTPARKVNLLALTNGVLEELGQMPLPAGQYTQLRLMLQANGGGSPANSVVPTGGSEQPLDTPSAVQTGIKVIHPFTVPAGGLADVVLDFDACHSVVRRGNGTFGLKPVVAGLPRVVAEIVGHVDPAMTGTLVSAQAGGNVVRATTPDATGAFRLAYLDPAATPNVNVVITADGRTTAVVADVPVALASTTHISTTDARISLPDSTTRTAGGSVLPASALATVRALQAAGPAGRVQVRSVNASDTGAYTTTLPIAAPLLAPYATPLPLAFAPVTASAARYTLEASAAGFVTQETADPINLTTANATVDFTLVPAP